MRDLRILVVDDERAILELLSEYLRARGCVVEVAEDGEEAWERLLRGGIDLVISDVKMPRLSGPELLERIHQREEPVAVVLMTGYGTIDAAVRAMRGGASDYLLKPFKLRELYATIERAAGTLERQRRSLWVQGVEELLQASRACRLEDAHALLDQLVQVSAQEDHVDGAALMLTQPACKRLVLHNQTGTIDVDLEHAAKTGKGARPCLSLPFRFGDEVAGHLVTIGTRQLAQRRAIQCYADIVGESLRRLWAEHPLAFAKDFSGHRAVLPTGLPSSALDAWCDGTTARQLRRDPGELDDTGAEVVIQASAGAGPLWQAVWMDLTTQRGAWVPLLSEEAARRRWEYWSA
ncbi:MAG TPA: response regulator [Myxococcota bacterium]|nr:response regulator [Myxococcota bacterium]